MITNSQTKNGSHLLETITQIEIIKKLLKILITYTKNNLDLVDQI